jgi:hypothetical protein
MLIPIHDLPFPPNLPGAVMDMYQQVREAKSTLLAVWEGK